MLFPAVRSLKCRCWARSVLKKPRWICWQVVWQNPSHPGVENWTHLFWIIWTHCLVLAAELVHALIISSNMQCWKFSCAVINDDWQEFELPSLLFHSPLSSPNLLWVFMKLCDFHHHNSTPLGLRFVRLPCPLIIVHQVLKTWNWFQLQRNLKKHQSPHSVWDRLCIFEALVFVFESAVFSGGFFYGLTSLWILLAWFSWDGISPSHLSGRFGYSRRSTYLR